MARVVKVFQTLRNNWKKTVFFSGLATYGVYYGRDKYLEFNLMKAYAQEAVQYGEQKLNPHLLPRHVTVILNPVANKKASKADYEKYCAPLFNLAGLKVSLVITEAEGQAKDLMEIMENTDCVVVAGGDGTVHEVVTGLLRRSDSQNALKRFPIGIVPVGKTNTVAFRLNKSAFDANDMKAKILGESTMAVVRQVLGNVDVMKVEGEQGRTVYSLGQLNIGQIRNTLGKLDEYWYLGQRAKPYLTFFFQSFKNLAEFWDDHKPVEISYTKPCSGCSKCYHLYDDTVQQKSDDTKANQSSSSRWWHMFMPRNRSQNLAPDPRELELERIKSTVNEECDQWHNLTVYPKNIIIRNELDNHMEMIVHPSEISRSQFVQEGIRFYKNEQFKGNGEPPFQTVNAKDYRISLPMTENSNSAFDDNDDIHEIMATKGISEEVTGKLLLAVNQVESPNAIKELDTEETEVVSSTEAAVIQGDTSSPTSELDHHRWLSIDNETYDHQSSLRISLLPRKLQIYHAR